MVGWLRNLRLGEDGYQHYRFVLRGVLYEGNTGCPLWKDARDWLNAYKGRISKNEVGIVAAPTVKLAYLHWVDTKKGKVSQSHLDRAADAIELHVLPHIGQKPVDQVTNQDIEILISHYLERPSKRITGPSKRTRSGANTLLLYLRNVFNHMVSMGKLKEVPWQVKNLSVKKKLRPYVPIERASSFFAEVYRTRNLPVMIAVRAMFWMGLRECEGIGLRWEWFSYDMRYYTPGLTKGGEAETMVTEQGLRSLLWCLIWDRFSGVKPISGLVVGEHIQGFTKKCVGRSGEAIGVEGITPHSMRRSFATNLARAGKSAHQIQQALRHKTLETSEGYVQLTKRDLEDSIMDLQKRQG
jgi:integrase